MKVRLIPISATRWRWLASIFHISKKRAQWEMYHRVRCNRLTTTIIYTNFSDVLKNIKMAYILILNLGGIPGGVLGGILGKITVEILGGISEGNPSWNLGGIPWWILGGFPGGILEGFLGWISTGNAEESLLGFPIGILEEFLEEPLKKFQVESHKEFL